MSVYIPLWEECASAIERETATPLEVFVYNNEPAGADETDKFRRELAAALDFVAGPYAGKH